MVINIIRMYIPSEQLNTISFVLMTKYRNDVNIVDKFSLHKFWQL